MQGDKLNHHQLSGLNGMTLAFDREGRVDPRILWAKQDQPGQPHGSVSDYLNDGYELVHPKRVERLPGGTFRCSEGLDYGVRFDFDKKADRVTNPLGLVMMFRPDAVTQRQAEERDKVGSILARKSAEQDVAKKAANGRIDAAVFAEQEDEGARSIT